MLRIKLSLAALLFLSAILLCSCGKQSPPQGPAKTPQNNAAPDEALIVWQEQSYPEAGFVVSAPFPSGNDPLESSVGYSHSWYWVNEDLGFFSLLLVEEIPIFLHDQDAQRITLTTLVHSSMASSGVENYGVEWSDNSGRLTVSASGRDRDGFLIRVHALMANKAFYVWLAADDGNPDTHPSVLQLIDSFRLLDDYPQRIADAEAAESSPLFIDYDMLEAKFPELAEYVSDGLSLREDPSRGLHYQGDYLQPELDETQLGRLQKIRNVIHAVLPQPWETWVYEVRRQLYSIDTTLQKWGRICFVWEQIDDPSRPIEYRLLVLEAISVCEGIPEHKARELLQQFYIPDDLQDRILNGLSALTAREVDVWLDGPGD